MIQRYRVSFSVFHGYLAEPCLIRESNAALHHSHGGIDNSHTGAILELMSDNTPRTAELRESDVTAKKQSLVHLGTTLRDALEAIGASYDPPMRWQDLARQVIKNFTGSAVHEAALKRAQLRLDIEGDQHAIANALFAAVNADAK